MASLQPQQEGWLELPRELDEPERPYNQQDSEAPKPDISFASGAIYQSSRGRVISEIKGHELLVQGRKGPGAIRSRRSSSILCLKPPESILQQHLAEE
ncbi:hypothetical protein VCV18_009554 [Metarhizium anisopliae]